MTIVEHQHVPEIAGHALPDTRRPARITPRLVGFVALALGLTAAVYYAHAGLTLAHFDAKGHLVVTRRIVDSITPGWLQIGAVWLPLPHLINLLPIQFDFFYRTGAFAVAVSIASFGLAAWAIATMILTVTGSRAAAALGTAAFAANPNVLYLQATPMTEPLLWGLACWSVVLSRDALASGTPIAIRSAGLVTAAAVLTRYEAWPICAALLTFGALALLRQGTPWRQTIRQVAGLAVYPAVAVLAFLALSRATVGEWFVRTGFFVPEPDTLDQPVGSALAVWRGLNQLTTESLAWIGVLGLTTTLIVALRDRRRALDLLPLSMVAAALLPWFAFYQGHVFRVRYMTALLPAVAVGAGLLVGRLRRRWLLAGALMLLAALALGPRPFDRSAAMPLEAQWDTGLRVGRQQITAYLARTWDGEPIMASMGSLAHYMHELSGSGFRLRDFLHEGNGDIWLAALAQPDPMVEWILIEESARGGDMLAALARQRPAFLAGYDKVAEGGGTALYRRRPPRSRSESVASPGR
ncbi:MAG: hypothetical protein NTV05_07710 [Acidobacteria bacterium]|nr:hypothetical protein [Acidobacteriota bacterium]